jgi:putative SOS response-associated peptidase YedK
MCFHAQQSKTAQQLEYRFNAKFTNADAFAPGYLNGFEHPNVPVITNIAPTQIEMLQWGLIPFWAKDKHIQKNTLNARIETINEKASFKSVVNNRCLILFDSFYEWQWLDASGKSKQKYELALPQHEAFGIAGLWSKWIDKHTGEVIHSFSILTMPANTLMSTIHNTKKRMPIIIHRESEKEWLDGGALQLDNDRLIATQL